MPPQNTQSSLHFAFSCTLSHCHSLSPSLTHSLFSVGQLATAGESNNGDRKRDSIALLFTPILRSIKNGNRQSWRSVRE